MKGRCGDDISGAMASLKHIAATVRPHHAIAGGIVLIWIALACQSSDPVAISAHDPARIIEENGQLAVYYSGIESVYVALEDGTSSLGVGHDDDAPLTGAYTPQWVEDSVVADVEVNTAPAMLDAQTMYYCKADWETDDGAACIGRATRTNTDTAPWTDDGQPVLCSTPQSVEQGAPFAIDPAVIQDGEQLWMVYGSHYSGIWLVELDPVTGAIRDNAAWSEDSDVYTHLADYPDGAEENYVEAPFLFADGGYYYLFVNWDQCCMGADSTYNIRVGRANDIDGPYLDQQGVDLREGGGTLFLDSEGDVIGPGHAGITQTAAHGLLFSFHYYDGSRDGEHALGIREVYFEDGWPQLGDWKISHPNEE